MRKTAVKYSILIFMLLIYINRGFFLVPFEIENHDNKEINSVIEWITHLVTGESNDMDEDGDLQSDCNSVKTVSISHYQEFTQYHELLNIPSAITGKHTFPDEENIRQRDFYFQIDHPPQMIFLHADDADF